MGINKAILYKLVGMAILTIAIITAFNFFYDNEGNGIQPQSSTQSSEVEHTICIESLQYHVTIKQEHLTPSSSGSAISLDLSADIQGRLTVIPFIMNEHQSLIQYQWETLEQTTTLFKDEGNQLQVRQGSKFDQAQILQADWISSNVHPLHIKPGEQWQHQALKHKVLHERITESNWHGETDQHGVLVSISASQQGEAVLPDGISEPTPFKRHIQIERLDNKAYVDGSCKKKEKPMDLVNLDRKSLHKNLRSRRVSKTSMTLEKGKALISTLEHAPSTDERIHVLSQLTDALRIHDQLAVAVADTILKRASQDPGTVSIQTLSLIGALAGSQSAAGQHQLNRLIKAFQTHQDTAHLDAVVRNLNLLVAPEQSMLATLEELLRSDLPEEIHNTVILSMGSLVGRSVDSPTIKRILESFAEALHKNPTKAFPYIKALSNSRLLEAENILKATAANHPSNEVRQYAKSALEGFQPNAVVIYESK